MKFSATKILIFSVLLMLAPLSFSFLSLRSMMSEGAHWYYSILDHCHYFSDPLFFRYVDFLIQYPAIFFLRHFGDSFSIATANSIAAYLLSFGWTFHPIISLFITYRILHSHSRKDLFIFPVLGFLSAFMPASAYAVALALPAMSFFWPVFFYIFFAKGNGIKDYIVSALLLAGLAFCYEPTIIFFILFILMAITDLLWQKEKSKNFNIYLILICMVSIAFLLYVISTVPDKNTGPFWRSLLYGNWATRLLGMTVTLSVFIVLFFNFAFTRFKIIFNILAIVIFSAGTFYFMKRMGRVYSRSEFEGALGFAYDARSSALPMTWCVAAMCWVFCAFLRDSKWLNSNVSRMASALVLAAAVGTAFLDFNQTREWNFYFGRFQQFVSEQRGCVYVPYTDFLKEYKAPSVEAYGAPFSSMMAQILDAGSEPIRTLIFVGKEDVAKGPPIVSCAEQGDGKFFRSEWGFQVLLNLGRLKFSEEDLLKKEPL